MIQLMIGLAIGNILLAVGLPAAAQQPTKIIRIGCLSAGDPASRGYRIDAFRHGLKDLGYIEGKNILIEYRFAQTDPERLPELARELVALRVDIIFVTSRPATQAAKNATQIIPIITSSSDPVGSKYVAGLAQPPWWEYNRAYQFFFGVGWQTPRAAKGGGSAGAAISSVRDQF